MNISDIADRATISVPEAAELLGIGSGAAYEAIKRDQIPALRLGRTLRVPVPALLALLGRDEAEPDSERMIPRTGISSDPPLEGTLLLGRLFGPARDGLLDIGGGRTRRLRVALLQI